MRAAIATLGLVTVASPAFAQSKTETELGSRIPIPERARIPETAKLSEVDRGRVTMEAFARCTIDRERGAVGSALALPVASAGYDTAMAKLASDECLSGGSMRFKGRIMRGALFSELYRRRERGYSGLPAIPVFDAQAPIEERGDAAIHWWLNDVATCVVGQHLAIARKIVLSPTASKVQNEAFATLIPLLGACVPAGKPVTLNKTVLEGAMAEVLYRQPSSASSTKPEQR